MTLYCGARGRTVLLIWFLEHPLFLCQYKLGLHMGKFLLTVCVFHPQKQIYLLTFPLQSAIKAWLLTYWINSDQKALGYGLLTDFPLSPVAKRDNTTCQRLQLGVCLAGWIVIGHVATHGGSLWGGEGERHKMVKTITRLLRKDIYLVWAPLTSHHSLVSLAWLKGFKVIWGHVRWSAMANHNIMV